MATTDLGLDLGRYKLGWSDAEDYVFKPKRGLNEDIIKEMSWMKGEPDWMRDIRLKSYQHFLRRPMPSWGGDMSEIYFDDIVDNNERIWDSLENYKEVAEALEATNESVITHRLNDMLAVLTILSAVILPLTLITGFYGMNIDSLPFAHYGAASVVVLAIVMAGIAGGVIWYFRKRKWL